MKKKRTTLATDVSTEVMFISDRTCCKCRERGKTVQIHHIDENPSNNEIDNLSVLCLECHNETQIQGGFGRKLNSDLVMKYRNEWIERVKKRRDEADRLAIEKVVGISIINSVPTFIEGVPYSKERNDKIVEYINSLPGLKTKLKFLAKDDWDSGITAKMIGASYEYVDSLETILITLASFYPEGSFERDTHRYFSRQIALRYQWHRSYAEPNGSGTGGTIINITVSGAVIEDVEKMIEDMVTALIDYDDRFDWHGWSTKWRRNE